MEPHVIELNFREMSGDKCGYCHICGDKTIYEYDSVKFTYHFKDKKNIWHTMDIKTAKSICEECMDEMEKIFGHYY